MKSNKSMEVFELFASMKKIFGLLRDFHKLQTQNDLESAIMSFMKFHENVSQAMIVHRLKVPKQTVSYAIGKLENEGAIETKTCKEDKRKKILILTEKGKTYAEKSLKPLMKLHESLFDDIGEEKILRMKEDVKELTELIEKNVRRLDG